VCNTSEKPYLLKMKAESDQLIVNNYESNEIQEEIPGSEEL